MAPAQSQRTRSSAVEHCLDTAGVGSSNLSACIMLESHSLADCTPFVTARPQVHGGSNPSSSVPKRQGIVRMIPCGLPGQGIRAQER